MATQVDGEPKEQESGTVYIVRHQSGTMLENQKKKRDSLVNIVRGGGEPEEGVGSGSMVGFGERGEVLSMSPPLGAKRSNLIAFINSRSGGFSFISFSFVFPFNFILTLIFQEAKGPKFTTNFASFFPRAKSTTFLMGVPNLASLNIKIWRIFKSFAVVEMGPVVGC